jgi:hypothetical protein
MGIGNGVGHLSDEIQKRGMALRGGPHHQRLTRLAPAREPGRRSGDPLVSARRGQDGGGHPARLSRDRQNRQRPHPRLQPGNHCPYPTTTRL